MGATPAIRILLTKAYHHRRPCLLLLVLALLVVLTLLVDLGLGLRVALAFNLLVVLILLVDLGLGLRVALAFDLLVVLKSILTVKITKWNLHLLLKSITVAYMTITAIMTKYRMVYPSQQL